MKIENTGFLPEDYLEKKMARRTNGLCLLLFAVVMAGVIGAFYVTDRKRQDVRELQQQVGRQFEEAARRVEQLEELHQRKQEMIRKAQVTSVLVERVPRTLVLAELINHMPAGLSLTDFGLETKTVRAQPRPRTAIERSSQNRRQQRQAVAAEPVVEIPSTEVHLDLTGLAPTDLEVSEFISRISRHAMFREVTLVFSEQVEVEDRPMRKFRITLVLDQNTDLESLEPTLVRRGGSLETGKSEIASSSEVSATTQMSVTAAVPTAGQP